MSEVHSKKDQHPESVQHELVLQSGSAWNGQAYQVYPAGRPQLSVMRVSLPPQIELP